MNKKWMVPALAVALTMSLTACGGNRDGNNGTVNGNGTTGSGSVGNGSASGSLSDPYAGSGSLENGSMGGGNPATAPSGSAAGSGAASGSQTRNSRTSYNGYTATRRTAYDYLNDGRYAADGNGQVNGRWNTAGQDLTQGARDLVRGAGNAIGDVGRGVGNAVGDVGRGVQNAARSATNY